MDSCSREKLRMIAVFFFFKEGKKDRKKQGKRKKKGKKKQTKGHGEATFIPVKLI